MNRLMNWLENHFSPAMNKVNHNVWIVTLKDSINQIMPLIFLGSIFSMLTLPGSALGWEWWPDFGVPQGWTMGMVSIMMAFLVPFNLMEKSRLRSSRTVAGIAGVILFAIAITPQLAEAGAVGFSHAAFGAGGMFIAIVTGVITGAVIRLLGKFSFFKEESAIPDFVRAWFDQMLPIGVIVIAGWIVIQILGFDLYHAVLSLVRPLQGFSEIFWGFLALNLIQTILYSMGISAWVMTPITAPIMLSAIEANMAGAANVFTGSFKYAYLTIGGIGCTLGLAILMLRSKSKKLNALGKAVIVPSVFNINEPVVFGAIAWNPILMTPMILNCCVACSISWLFTKVIPLGAIPKILFQLWYCPYPISTWLATGGSLTSIIVVLIIFAATTAVWYPFFKIYERQCIADEQVKG